ncbi:MAG TPA: nitroreductase [Polyangiaceae bacterium]|nr:nitroreductase [Polyangiaceae bacterium]
MDIAEALRGRRTVHQFRAQPLPPGALDRALHAAVEAPNHHLTEPWRFVHAGVETRQRLLDLGIEIATGGIWSGLSAAARAQLEVTVIHPAELLVVSQVLARLETRHEDFAAVACAVYGMSLSLWAEGIGSKWSTGGVTDHPRVYETLGIDAEKERIVGFFWIGIAARPELEKPRRRKPLAQVVRRLP